MEKIHAKFALDNTSKNLTFIMLLVSCGDGRLRFSTREKVSPTFWDDVKRRTGNSRIDRRLANIETWVQDYFEEKGKEQTRADELRDLLNERLKFKAKSKPSSSTFFPIMEEICQMAEDRKIRHGKGENKPYKEGTIRNWRKTIATIRQFDPTLSIESITKETYGSFLEWAREHETKHIDPEERKLYTDNYIDALIKDWKSMMKWADKKGLSSNTSYKDFLRINEDPEKIDLTEEEIALLKDLELTGSREEIRDRYVMNLYMGLRISDLETLDAKKNIKNGCIVLDYTQKTESSVMLPLHPEVIRIMNKPIYNGKFPKQYNREHVNREIKLIAKEAGITDETEIREIRGGVKIEGKDAMIPRWQLISTHTSRRTAITYYLREGVPVKTLSVLLGVSEKTIMKYYDKRNQDDHLKVFNTIMVFQKKAS